jgi:hypothetical protein
VAVATLDLLAISEVWAAIYLLLASGIAPLVSLRFLQPIIHRRSQLMLLLLVYESAVLALAWYLFSGGRDELLIVVVFGLCLLPLSLSWAKHTPSAHVGAICALSAGLFAVGRTGCAGAALFAAFVMAFVRVRLGEHSVGEVLSSLIMVSLVALLAHWFLI